MFVLKESGRLRVATQENWCQERNTVCLIHPLVYWWSFQLRRPPSNPSTWCPDALKRQQWPQTTRCTLVLLRHSQVRTHNRTAAVSCQRLELVRLISALKLAVSWFFLIFFSVCVAGGQPSVPVHVYVATEDPHSRAPQVPPAPQCCSHQPRLPRGQFNSPPSGLPLFHVWALRSSLSALTTRWQQHSARSPIPLGSLPSLQMPSAVQEKKHLWWDDVMEKQEGCFQAPQILTRRHSLLSCSGGVSN